MASDTETARDRLLRGITVVVTAIWSFGTVVQIINPAHQVPNTVNVIMGMIVSALFGAAAVSRSRNGNGGG